jgi:hypothetical protein
VCNPPPEPGDATTGGATATQGLTPGYRGDLVLSELRLAEALGGTVCERPRLFPETNAASGPSRPRAATGGSAPPRKGPAAPQTRSSSEAACVSWLGLVPTQSGVRGSDRSCPGPRWPGSHLPPRFRDEGGVQHPGSGVSRAARYFGRCDRRSLARLRCARRCVRPQRATSIVLSAVVDVSSALHVFTRTDAGASDVGVLGISACAHTSNRVEEGRRRPSPPQEPYLRLSPHTARTGH